MLSLRNIWLGSSTPDPSQAQDDGFLQGLLFAVGYEAAVFVVVADGVLWVVDVGGQDQEDSVLCEFVLHCPDHRRGVGGARGWGSLEFFAVMHGQRQGR